MTEMIKVGMGGAVSEPFSIVGIVARLRTLEPTEVPKMKIPLPPPPV